jgi:hypothetical protein
MALVGYSAVMVASIFVGGPSDIEGLELAAEADQNLLVESSDIVHHYTTANRVASIQRNGLWAQSSATDIGTLTSREAVETLGVKTAPDFVIDIRNGGQFVANRPPIVQPHPLGPGGGLDLTNPARVGPESILGFRPVPQ